jgi:Glycosyltransferase family 87
VSRAPAAASPSRHRSLIYAALLLLALLTSLFLARSTDLRVYWYAVTGYFGGLRSAYGPDSGIGHPMEYRYPPVTYLLLYPLKWMTLRVAGFCWIFAAWLTGISSATLAIRIRRLRFNALSILACCAFLLAYLVLAVRYGNVQPFVIAWLLAALVLSETYPACSGILLALAVTFKIWPIMFLPWFLRRNRRRAALYFAASLAALWLLPFLIFGSARYLALLHEWYSAVRQVGTTYSEFYYFPSQSLRGILLRYLTPVSPPLDFFPRINILSLAPKTAVQIWGIASLAIYSAIVVAMLRSGPQRQWAWDGAAFVMYSLLEPYAVKSGLISLAPAALIAASLFTLAASTNKTRALSWGNNLFLASCLISFIQAILQYKPWQRMLLTIGLDFWGEILLLVAYVVWILYTPVTLSLRGE